jgi:hypothetical protein
MKRAPPFNPRRRHPLCPYCHYDLIATVADNNRTCPECGAHFNLDELHYQPAESDWSARDALSALMRATALRGCLAVLAWMILAAAANLLGNIPAMHGLIPLIVGAAGGYLIGRILIEGLAGQAGFDSLIVPLTAAAAAFVVVGIAQLLLEVILPFSSGWSRMILIGSALIVCWTKIISTYALDTA